MSYLRARTFRPTNGCILFGFTIFGLIVIGTVIAHVIGAFL